MATLQHFKERLKKTAALLPTLHSRNPSYRGNPAITILRIFLWLMPALFIPLAAWFFVLSSQYLPTPVGISLSILFLITATAGIGYFEELLTIQQMRALPANPKRELLVSTIIFILLQIAIAPTACILAVCCFGAATARGFF